MNHSAEKVHRDIVTMAESKRSQPDVLYVPSTLSDAERIVYGEATPRVLISEGWRPVSKRRARKLRNRGEDVRWFAVFNSHAWFAALNTD